MIRRVRILIWACSAALGLGPCEAQDVRAHAARIAGDGMRTRFVMDLSARVDMKAVASADAHRVTVEIPAVAVDAAARAARGRGLFSGYRLAPSGPGRARIILDATGPVRIDKAFTLDPMDGQPARLVVEVVPAGKAPPLVMIDPGHGGVDPGAIGTDGVAEKTITLDLAKALKTKLERSGRVRAGLTREDDRFASLADRLRTTQESGASLFLSLHADSFAAAQVRGATVYVLSESAPASAAAVRPEDETAAILADLAERETRNAASSAAAAIVAALKGTARLNKNPFRAAGLKVLRAPGVPSVLIELGYLSSPEDSKLLASPAWREAAAEALAKAVEDFLLPRTAGAR